MATDPVKYKTLRGMGVSHAYAVALAGGEEGAGKLELLGLVGDSLKELRENTIFTVNNPSLGELSYRVDGRLDEFFQVFSDADAVAFVKDFIDTNYPGLVLDYNDPAYVYDDVIAAQGVAIQALIDQYPLSWRGLMKRFYDGIVDEQEQNITFPSGGGITISRVGNHGNVYMYGEIPCSDIHTVDDGFRTKNPQFFNAVELNSGDVHVFEYGFNQIYRLFPDITSEPATGTYKATFSFPVYKDYS